MPFNVGESLNYVVDSILLSPTVKSIVKSPILTALIITIIIVFLILFIFQDVESEESIGVMVVRSGFWIFLIMLGIISLHNHVLFEECAGVKTDETLTNIMTPDPTRDINPDRVPVNIGGNYQPQVQMHTAPTAVPMTHSQNTAVHAPYAVPGQSILRR